MTNQEGSIRRQWMLAFIPLYAISGMYYFNQFIGLNMGIGDFFVPFPVLPYAGIVPLLKPGVREFLMSPLVISVLFFVMIFFVYYFACEKASRSFLKFILVMMPINAMILINNTAKIGFNIPDLVTLLVYILGFMLPFWISSYRFYKVNRVKEVNPF